MDLSLDLIDVLAEFENFGVEYLVVGGWAVATHAQPRFTKVSISGSAPLRPI